MFHLTSIARSEEMQLAINSLSKAVSYAALFLVVATVVRKQEIPRFGLLIVALACITAIGTVIEYRSINDELAPKFLPGLDVAPQPHSISVRPEVTGPTQHGLAVATMLAMAVPFVVWRLLEARDGIQRLLCALALALIVSGAVATLRKTGLVVPLVAVATMALYRPREIARLLPGAAVVLVLVLAVAPGALQGITDELAGKKRYGSESRLSVEGRTSTYAAVKPDVLSRPLLGRGYGTYDPNAYQTKDIPTHHRYLDNQYLTALVETGILGLIAYVGLGVTGIAALHRSARSRDRDRAGPAIAIIGAIAAFLVASALFNLMAFVQVPLLFFSLLGLGVAATAVDRPSLV